MAYPTHSNYTSPQTNGLEKEARDFMAKTINSLLMNLTTPEKGIPDQKTIKDIIAIAITTTRAILEEFGGRKSSNRQDKIDLPEINIDD